MPTDSVVIAGVVTPEGKLELISDVPLPPGQVSVTVEPVAELPAGDPFFDMLREVRAIRQGSGMSADAVLAGAAAVRAEMNEQVEDAGRLQGPSGAPGDGG